MHTILVVCFLFFFLMIRRPPRSTLDRSSAASDVYKRQHQALTGDLKKLVDESMQAALKIERIAAIGEEADPVSYTHLRAHETVLDLVCRLLLEKKKSTKTHMLSRLPDDHNQRNNYTLMTIDRR